MHKPFWVLCWFDFPAFYSAWFMGIITQHNTSMDVEGETFVLDLSKLFCRLHENFLWADSSFYFFNGWFFTPYNFLYQQNHFCPSSKCFGFDLSDFFTSRTTYVRLDFNAYTKCFCFCANFIRNTNLGRLPSIELWWVWYHHSWTADLKLKKNLVLWLF